MSRMHALSAALLAALFLLPGCSGLTQSLSPNYPELLAKVPFKADRPIAREIRYIYFSVTEINENPGKPIVATNLDPAGGTAASPARIAPPPTPGTKWSEVTSEQARQASKKGEHKWAADLHGVATAQAETEIAMDNMVNGVNTAFNIYFATAQAFQAAAQAFQDSGGQKLHDWAVEKTGAIGNAAPPGSVLYLDIKDITHITRFDMDSKWDSVVTATLVDGKGRIIASSQGLELHTHSGKDTKPPPGFVMLEKLPQEKSAQFPSVNSIPYGFLKATLINGAVADLYKRLEALT